MPAPSVLAADILPITGTLEPEDQDALAAAVREAAAARTPIYPIGGATSLDFGLAAKAPGLGVSLRRLDRVVDYPARDMTITVEAGITMARLGETLAAERQWLPIDAPQADRATLGGVVATNFSGPRRYGFGTIRDYVIGITAVDGRGTTFHGGGRVVKNVAGYDFCKLLTGSLGAIGIISQVTLKVKPRPEKSALLVCDVDHFDRADSLLAALVTSLTYPSAIELLTGPIWREGKIQGNGEAAIAVGLEGSEPEVAWMLDQLTREWREQGFGEPRRFCGRDTDARWNQLTEFPAAEDSPLVIKASIRPSRVVEFCRLVTKIDAACSIQAHAANGVVIVRFANLPEDFSPLLVRELQPAAIRSEGSLIVLRAPGVELTRQATWGNRPAAADVMGSIKTQFDPDDILNPGRFFI